MARLFDRLPSGHRLTDTGEEVLLLAEQMALTSSRLEALVFGRDQTVAGPLRVTMTPMLTSHLLMPDLAAFASSHPPVELNILSSDEPASLTNRDADVAIGVVYDPGSLPQNFHALKGPDLFGGVYLMRDLLAAWDAGAGEPMRWTLKEYDGLPDWARGTLTARALGNRFTALAGQLGGRLQPDYPIAYDAGKALHAAAKARGEHGFGAHWAGQGAPLARAMPATQLVGTLRDELRRCQA